MNRPEEPIKFKLKDPRYPQFKNEFCKAISTNKYVAVTAPRGFCLNTLLDRGGVAAENDLIHNLHNDGKTIVHLDGRRLQTYPRSLCLQMAFELLDNLSKKDVQQKDRYQAIKRELVKEQGTASPSVLKRALEEIFNILPEEHLPLILVLSNIHLFKEGVFGKEAPYYTLDKMLIEFRLWHEEQIFPTSDLLIGLAGFLDVKRQTSYPSPFNIAAEINLGLFSMEQVRTLCSQLEGLTDTESSAEKVFSLTAGYPLHTFAILQYLKKGFSLEEARKYIMWEDPSGHLRHILNLFSVKEDLLKLSYYIYKKDTERLQEISREVLEEAYYEGFLKDPQGHAFCNELIASYVAKIFSSPNNLLGFLNVRDREFLKEMLNDIAEQETKGRNNLFLEYLNTHTLQVRAKQWIAECHFADAYLKKALEEIESTFEIKSISYRYNPENRNLHENSSNRQISSADWRKIADSILCCRHISFFHKHTLLDCDKCPLIVDDKLLSLCRKNGYACFPIRLGMNEGARFVYGTVLLFHQEIENMYPLLVPLFRDVNDTMERLYYRHLLMETVDFTGQGPWIRKKVFLEDLGVFLQEMFQSQRVYLFLSDPTRQTYKLACQYPKEERRQDIREEEPAFVRWVADSGEVLNFTHPNDFTGLPWLDLPNLPKEEGGWAALAFPLKGKHGRSARGVAAVLSATPSPDNHYFFTSFHKIVAKLIGKYAGSMLDQLEDRENMVITTQQAAHRQTKIVSRIRQCLKDESPERSTEIDKLLENFTASLRLHMDFLMLDEPLKEGFISEVVMSYRGEYYDFPCRFDQTGERKVWLSPESVKYILKNLVSNHEKVKTSKGLPPQSRFRLSFYEKEKYLVLCYEDELGGLPDEIKNKFPELQASETGLGIGLRHCHLLMEKMGGRMETDNLPDNIGAVFKFYFMQAQ